jgi:hypothetical protein
MKTIPSLISFLIPPAVFAVIEFVPAFKAADRWMDRNPGWAVALVIVSCIPFGILIWKDVNAYRTRRMEG